MAYDINKALEQLEENLKNVDSARKQVENTVNASDELRKTVNGYIVSLTNLYNEIHKWKEELSLGQTLLDSKTQKVLADLKTSCETVSTTFQTSTKGMLDAFNEQNNILTQRVEELKAIRGEAKNEFKIIKDTIDKNTDILNKSHKEQDKTLAQIVSSVDEVAENVNGHSEKLSKQIDDSHQSHIKQIDNILSKIDYIIQILDALTTSTANIQTSCNNLQTSCNNLQSSCDKIKSSIDEVKDMIVVSKNASIKSININRWILIIGIIVIIALHFI